MGASLPAIDFAADLVAEARKIQSENGTVSLRWAAPAESSKVELQQSSTPSFATPISRYTGSEAGSVLTGLAEGEHFFRIRATDMTGRPGPWTEPLEVQVVFMERGRLFLLLSLGGLVVLLTVGAVLSGAARTRNNP